MNTGYWRLVLLAVLAVFLMAMVPVIIKYIEVDPWLIGAFRLAVSVVGLILLAGMTRRPLIARRENWIFIFLLGLVFATHWLTYFYSIQLSTASIAAIGVSTFGAHLLLLGWFVHKQPPHWLELFCVLLAFAGVYMVVPEFNLNDGMTIGLILAVISGFLYALLPLMHQKYRHINGERRTFGQFFVAMVIFSLGLPQAEWSIPKESWIGLVVLGVVCTLVAHSLWIKVSTELNHVVTSVVYYLYVPIALFFSFVFLDEVLSSAQLLGASLILLANVLGIWFRSRRHNKLFQ
ncbi:MAG: DMT family transporter [Kangiella sp.]|jgi:drug/metabolite transporter (DMT)-like permease|nr:DMT family transporter [Kangiella sp.]